MKSSFAAQKVLFIMPRLGSGGAERVVFNLIHLLPPEEFDCSLLLFEGSGYLVEKLPSNCNVLIFNHSRLLKSIGTLWKVMNSGFDLIFASGYHNPLVALIGYFSDLSEKIILRETAVVGMDQNRQKKLGLLKLLIPPLYQKCSSIIFQSQNSLIDYEQTYSFKLTSSVILFNPSRTLEFFNPSFKKSVFLVGSLIEGKNFGYTLSLVKKAGLEKHPVEVFGDGPLRRKLETEAKNLGLCVTFHGQVNSLEDYWKDAGVLVLTSKSESMPNVVIEAAMAGVPTVSLISPGGLRELYELGPWGTLAQNEEEFVSAIIPNLEMSLETRSKIREQAQVVFAEIASARYIEFFRSLK